MPLLVINFSQTSHAFDWRGGWNYRIHTNSFWKYLCVSHSIRRFQFGHQSRRQRTERREILATWCTGGFWNPIPWIPWQPSPWSGPGGLASKVNRSRVAVLILELKFLQTEKVIMAPALYSNGPDHTAAPRNTTSRRSQPSPRVNGKRKPAQPVTHRVTRMPTRPALVGPACTSGPRYIAASGCVTWV